MLADILPTGYEVGVLNGAVAPGRHGRDRRRRSDRPVRDHDRQAVLAEPHHRRSTWPQPRCDAAKRFGADVVINAGPRTPLEVVRALTGGLGADVGDRGGRGSRRRSSCATELVRPGGTSPTSASTASPATLHLETLWIRNVTITTGLVDTSTTPTLLRLLAAGQIDADADSSPTGSASTSSWRPTTCSPTRDTGALKVVLERVPADT